MHYLVGTLSLFSDPSKRFQACFLLALSIHLLGFICFQFEVNPLNKPLPQSLDVLLLPPAEPIVSKPAKQSKHLNSTAASLAGAKSPVKAEKTPKIVRKRTVSMSHHQPQDANYLQRWQNKIEEVGKNHYPEQARLLGIQGSLRLLVAIQKDGTVKEIVLSQSSGHPVLDAAAKEIVALAAPFEPLPVEIASEIDLLEIIRTWQFRGTEDKKDLSHLLASR